MLKKAVLKARSFFIFLLRFLKNIFNFILDISTGVL